MLFRSHQLPGSAGTYLLEAAVERAEAWAIEQGVSELMLIGGAQLYTQGLAAFEQMAFEHHADQRVIARQALYWISTSELLPL